MLICIFFFFFFSQGLLQLKKTQKWNWCWYVLLTLKYYWFLLLRSHSLIMRWKGVAFRQLPILCFAEFFWKSSNYRIASFLQRFGWHIRELKQIRRRRKRERQVKMWLSVSAIIFQLVKLIMLEKSVLTILELNWNQRLGHEKTKLNICHHMLASSTQLQNKSFHVVERTRTSTKCQKMKKCTCKACKNTVFHCQICKFVGFSFPLSSWLLKLPIQSAWPFITALLLRYELIECVHITSRRPCWRSKQRNGGHLGGVKYSFGDWTLFLCKFLLLFHYANMASGHMSKHTLLIFNI